MGEAASHFIGPGPEGIAGVEIDTGEDVLLLIDPIKVVDFFSDDGRAAVTRVDIPSPSNCWSIFREGGPAIFFGEGVVLVRAEKGGPVSGGGLDEEEKRPKSGDGFH